MHERRSRRHCTRLRQTLTGALVAGFALTTIVAASLEPGEPIVLCVDPDWEPYERVTADGDYVGIAPDLLRLIFDRAGLEFDVARTSDWDESLRVARGGGCHAIGFLNQTADRDEWLLFTDPYFTDPNVIITRTEHPYVADLAALGDAVIALPRGTSIAERVARDYPDLRIVPVESEREAFEMVEDGTALLTLRSLTMAAYTIRKEGWFNLKVSGEVPAYRNELRIGIRQEYPELRDTLNAAVATILPREVNDAVNHHIAIEVAYEIDRQLILRIVLGFVAAVLLVLVWVWRERRHGLALQREIEARALTEGELRDSELRYRSLVDTAQEGIAVVQDRKIAFANPRLAEMLGYSETELSALASFAPLVADDDIEGALKNYERRIAGEPADPRYEISFKRRDTTVFPAELSATRITWRGRPATLNVIMDISERKVAEAEIHRLALHDLLTDLPNRRLLVEWLDRAIELADRHESRVAILFVDLDEFKPVNDTYGHEIGDRLLQEVAHRLSTALRQSDIVSRLGGDEFVVGLPLLESRDCANEVAAKLVKTLSAPYQIDAATISISASVGVGIYPDDASNAAELLRRADSEMYAKKRGPRTTT